METMSTTRTVTPDQTLADLKELLDNINDVTGLRKALNLFHAARRTAKAEDLQKLGIDPNDATLHDLRNGAIEKHLRRHLSDGDKHMAENSGKQFTKAFGVSIKFTSSGTGSNKLWNVEVTS